MLGNLFIAITVILFAYTIIWDISMFNKGKHNPYIIRNGKDDMPFLVRAGIIIFVVTGMHIFRSDTKIFHAYILVFILYSICLVVSTSIMNYLSYLKIKDKKIIIQTVIFDIITICVVAAFWWFITNKSILLGLVR